ncbi:putative disease resistance RPP13-like protein 1, partial [Bienertia sinuspersici]
KPDQPYICESRVFKEEIFPAFRLNNPDLGAHLKKCLAYCSLFPRDFDFKKDNLVQLWMAKGFLLRQGIRSLEQIGCEYFDELLWRSVFRLSHLCDQETPTYKIHEYVHRYAEILASDTFYRFEKDDWSSSIPRHKKARHLSLLCDSIKLPFFKEIEKCDGLRTLLLLSEHGTKVDQVPYSLFQKLELLRVLDLSCTDINELPESLGRLKHLRYLDASQTNLQRLPKSASELHGLQVLKLRDCSDLLELPKNLKNLTNLIHLDVDMKGLRCMPQSIGTLNHLKTLPAFIVGKKEGYRITELKNLKHLCGTVSLSGLDNVKDGAEAKEAMMSDKPFVKRMELQWSRRVRDESIAMDVLAAIQPHRSLKELHIINYGGLDFPAWLTSPSCMLNAACPSFGILQLEDCPNLCSMQSLIHMNSLQTLEIKRCPQLNSLPGLPASLQSLIIIESDVVKQQCLPEGSPQWCIIKAIRYVEIDYEIVDTGDS